MNDEHGDSSLAQSPLQGVVLCCTSIPPERRNKLAEIARQMGACHNYDLTGDVTHLLVGSIDSQKYKYVAKQRPDVKVVLPEWIDAVRESWMQGGGTDVAALEAEYRAPALFGLRICVTGFEDLTERQRLQQCVNENGAEYHGDLTKQVTHLIVASPTGKKYTYARQWAVNTVAVEWLLDSIERGMVLEESFYDPLMDPADRGRNSWNREALAHASRSKKRPLGDGGGLGRRDAGSRRKLRRTASAKLESQSYALWEGIAGASATTVMPEGQLRDTTQEFSLRNGQSPNNASTRTKKVPIRTSSPELLHSDGATGNPVPKRHGIFQGRLVFVTNFDDRKNSLVSGHLSANGAEVILSTEELEGFTGDDLQRGYLILPHNKPFGDAQIPKAAEPMQIVTEWWVESCLARKMLLGPSEGLFLQPFPHARVSGFEGVTICSTSFTDLDLLHVTRAVNLMGATYDEWFKESHHILISNTPRPSAEKVSFAQENGIPIVRKEWLLDSIAKGVKQPFDDYALFPLSRNPIERGDSAVISEQTRDDSLLSNENHRSSSKSKELEVEPDLVREKSSGATKVDRHAKRREKLQKRTSRTYADETNAHQINALSSAATDNDSLTLDLETLPSATIPTQPLRSLSPGVNSTRTAASLSSRSTAEPESSEQPVGITRIRPNRVSSHRCGASKKASLRSQSTEAPPAAASSESWSQKEKDMQMLLDHLKSSRPNNAAHDGTTSNQAVSSAHARRRKGLGRAISTGSATSVNSNVGAGPSAPGASAESGTGEQGGEDGTDGEGESPWLEGASQMASQALMYEDPGVQRAREKVMKQMGGRIPENNGGTVESIGLVKDSKREAGIAGRERRGRGLF